MPYPTAFIATITYPKVKAIMAKSHTIDHTKLLCLSDTGTIYFPVSHTTSYTIPDDHPPYLFIRFDKMMPPKTCQKQVKAYAPITHIPHVKTDDSNRSSVPAYHFGAWENFATVPQISAVSRPKKSKHIKAIDEFSEVISSFLSQKLAALLECHNYSSQLFLY